MAKLFGWSGIASKARCLCVEKGTELLCYFALLVQQDHPLVQLRWIRLLLSWHGHACFFHGSFSAVLLTLSCGPLFPLPLVSILPSMSFPSSIAISFRKVSIEHEPGSSSLSNPDRVPFQTRIHPGWKGGGLGSTCRFRSSTPGRHVRLDVVARVLRRTSPLHLAHLVGGGSTCRMAGRIVFVGNLPEHVREAEIEALLQGMGTIREIDLKLPPRPPVFAFVEFVREEDAEEAVRRLDGAEAFGVRLRVQFAKGKSLGGGPVPSASAPPPPASRSHDAYVSPSTLRSRVWVDYLPPRTSWQDLKDHFRSVGRVAFTDVVDDRGRKVGVVEFDRPEDAVQAARVMDGTLMRSRYDSSRIRVTEDTRGHEAGPAHYGWSSGVAPSRSTSPPSRSKERWNSTSHARGRGSRVLFDGLPPRTSWQDLKDQLRPLGPVAYTDVREEHGRVTGVAEFDNPGDAREAVRALDGTTFQGRFGSSQIRVWEEGVSASDTYATYSSYGTDGRWKSNVSPTRGRTPSPMPYVDRPRSRSRSPLHRADRGVARTSPVRGRSRSRSPPPSSRRRSRSPSPFRSHSPKQ